MSGSRADHVLPWLKRMARRDAYGVYFIFNSMEQGPTYRVSLSKYQSKDPHYRILECSATIWMRRAAAIRV